MDRILVEHHASPAKLDIMGVYDWPVWEKEVSTFPWTYDKQETCYILEGEAVITPDDDSEPITIEEGDLVIFPAGLSCTWEIIEDIEKHYQFK